MAEKSGGEAKGGGGGVSGKQLRYLFASGILGHHGGGKGKSGGKVTYHKGRSHALQASKKAAGNGTSTFRSKTGTARVKGLGAKASSPKNTPGNKFSRTAFGGKTAHLRSGSGPAKVDHSGTRAARVAAGRKVLEPLGKINNRTMITNNTKQNALARRLSVVQTIQARAGYGGQHASAREANREYLNMFSPKKRRVTKTKR